MHLVVYLDVLVLLNFLIGLFLLLCTALLTGADLTPRRLLLGSGLAGVGSLAALLPSVPLLTGAVQLAMAAGITWAAFRPVGGRAAAKLTVCYFGCNLLLAGTALLVGEQTGGLVQTNNLVIYFNLPPLVPALLVAGLYLAVRGVVFRFGRPEIVGRVLLYTTLWGEPLTLEAFLDTGCRAEQPGGRPMVFCTASAALAQLSPPLRQAAAAALQQGVPTQQVPFGYSFCTTASGQGVLPTVTLGQVKGAKPGGKAFAVQNAVLVLMKETGQKTPTAFFGPLFWEKRERCR